MDMLKEKRGGVYALAPFKLFPGGVLQVEYLLFACVFVKEGCCCEWRIGESGE